MTHPIPLLLFVTGVATAEPILLLVRGSESTTGCPQTPAAGSRSGAFREASALDVSEDLRRYFGGLSVQTTPILEAARSGEVGFCSVDAEAADARVLAAIVVKPLAPSARDDGELPAGAAFASRDACDFFSWLKCLEESLAKGTIVTFTFEVAGQRLTSIRCQDRSQS